MGIRDKLRKGVRKRLRSGRRARTGDRRTDPEAIQERRAKIKKARELARRAGESVGGADAQPRETDAEARDQFARAQRSAEVGPVLNASLDPMGSPERIETIATAGRGRGEEAATMEGLVLGNDETGSMEELVTGISPVSPAEQRTLDEAEAQGPTVDALVPGVGPSDSDGEPGLIVWDDDRDGRK